MHNEQNKATLCLKPCSASLLPSLLPLSPRRAPPTEARAQTRTPSPIYRIPPPALDHLHSSIRAWQPSYKVPSASLSTRANKGPETFCGLQRSHSTGQQSSNANADLTDSPATLPSPVSHLLPQWLWAQWQVKSLALLPTAASTPSPRAWRPHGVWPIFPRL